MAWQICAVLGLLATAAAYSIGGALPSRPLRRSRVTAQEEGDVGTRVPVPLRPLQRSEIVDKLDQVPVFSVVEKQTQQMVPTTENGTLQCTFHLDVAQATKALEELQLLNPRLPLMLAVTPLGTAFALCEWQQSDPRMQEGEGDADGAGLGAAFAGASLDPDDDDAKAVAAERAASAVQLRIQAATAEAAVAMPLLEDTPAPTLLLRRNRILGALPLFGSDAIRFASEEGADAGATRLPLFFSREDVRAAWGASGGAADAVPPLQVTDLRTLVWQMQYDTTQDWSPLLLVAPPASIDYVVAQGGGEPAPPPVELTPADVAGLVFGPNTMRGQYGPRD